MFAKGLQATRTAKCSKSARNPVPRSCSSASQPQVKVTCPKSQPLSEMTVKSFDQVPGPRGAARLPFVGAAFLFKPFTKNVTARPDLLAINLHKQYGNIVRIELPFGTTVFLKDPKDMLTVMEKEGRTPERPNFPLIMTYLKSRNVKTLATLKGEDWRRLRMKAQPSFLRPGSADPYLPAIEKVADDLGNYVEKYGHEDFRDVIFLYILECLFQFCFHRRLGALTATGLKENNLTATKVKELVTTLAKLPILPLYKLWRTKEYRIIESSMDHLLQISSVEVQRVIKSLRDEECRESDGPHLIERLLAHSGMTEQEAVMTMSDFFFGGSDTTSKNLAMIFYHLAKNPDQQKLLHQELASVAADGNITSEVLDKMEFLKACVKESMRLTYPLAPGPSRILQEDLVLSGYHVPKGTMATLCNVAYLHDPDFVKTPLEYVPQRWLRDKDRQKNETIPTVCFLPFGIGGRMCLGKRFAELIIYLSLIKVLQKYEMTLQAESLGAEIVYEIFPTINKPLKINFIPRSST
uniref:Cytochrome P450 n=1 Tax=Biomphalaria glabrata TaxID=6526 RepID=A0A2C9M2W3_BIOGL